MKKLLTIVTMVATLSGVSAFGQGSFLFTGSVKGVWDVFSTSGAKLGATNNVAFLFGSGTPLVDSILTSVPTNSPSSFSASTAWTDILTDSSFKLATNNSGNTFVSILSAANGAWQYNSNTSFLVNGTSSSGGSTTVFVIGWDAKYADPYAAQTAGSAVGWSAPFTYAYASNIGTPGTMAAAGLLPFGVSAVPEPGTMALAGLGGLSLLAFRRRKS